MNKANPSYCYILIAMMLNFSYRAVGVAFVFGCLVMIMAAFGFFFGSNAQKVCQSLEGPDYEGFENVSLGSRAT